jgi:hypothetical protein
MKNYKMINVSGKRSKGAWIYIFTFDGVVIGTKKCSIKQNRLEQLAFNFCLENQNLGFSTYFC